MAVTQTETSKIERREGLLYKEFVKEYLNPHKPVILVGALREWKAVGRWTPEFFAEQYGDREVKVDGRVRPLRDLVREVLDSGPERPAPYLRNYPVHDLSPELVEDIQPLPPYLCPNWLDTRFYAAPVRQILGRAVIQDVFIGGAGRSFPFLHYDLLNSHAFLSQIYGEKLYTLYSPGQTPFLYPSQKGSNRSLVDNIEEPDLSRFPLFAQATPIRAVLGAGDLIFIPARWWHTAKILEPSITISVNVANSSNWKGVVRDQYRNALSSPSLAHRLAAAPLAAYLASVGLYRAMRAN